MQSKSFVKLLLVATLGNVAVLAEVPDPVVAGLPSTIDFPLFVDCLDGPNATIPTGCAASNFHPDPRIDLADFAVVQRGYLLNPSALQNATETAGEISPVDNVDEYPFQGFFGSTATVDFATPSINNRPDLVVRLDIIRPNGSTASTTASCGTNARLDTVFLDATGTWKIRVRAYESWPNCGFGADETLRTGLYTLSLCLSNPVGIPIEFGEAQSNVFTCDCHIVNYEFTGGKGEVISLMYLGPAVTRQVRLYAPDGALLGASGGGAGASLNDVMLPLNGTYRIAVEAADGQASLSFSLGLTKLDDAVPIPFSTVIPGNLAVPAEADTYSFDGTFGTSVTVDFATPSTGNRPDLVARVDLVRPNGTVAATTATCGNNVRLDTIAIDMTGSWTVRVRAYESWFNCGFGPDLNLVTGDYSLVLCPSNAPPIAIAYGETKNGNFEVDCQIVNYQFAGVTGEIASIMYLGPASTRRVRLFAPNGALLATSGGGQGASLTDIALPLTGLYRISVEASDNQPAGSFSLGLSKLENSSPIAVDTLTPDSVELVAEAKTYSFFGVFGDVATADFSTPSVTGRPDLVVRLDLIRPNGTLATTTASCGNNVRLDSVLLDATGTWTVRVRAYESWFNCGFGGDTNLLTGDFNLTVCTSDAPATPIAYGQTRNGTLIADCQIVNYEFAGTASDIATIMYFGSAFSRRIQLFAPNGTVIATSGGGQGASLNDIILPTTGTYRIAVEAGDNQTGGDFSIGLSRLGATFPIALDTATAGSLGQIGELDAFSFSGIFGATTNVDYSTALVANVPDIVTRLDLVRPNGSVAATTATCGGNARLDNIRLDASGTWTARVRAYESWFNCGFGTNTGLLTGSYTIAVSLSNSPPTAIAYGQTRNGNLLLDSQIVNFQFAGSLGDLTTAVFYSPAFVRRIQLFAPNGILLAASGGGQGGGIVDLPLPMNGQYRLAVEAADNQPTGTFSVGLTELGGAAPMVVNTTTPGTINQAAEVLLYSINRTNGDVVSVNFVTPVQNNKPDLPVRLDFIRPDGSTASSTASCSGTAQLNNIAIDQTGLWTVRVRAYESWVNCGFGADVALLTGAFTVKVCPGVCP